MRRLAPAILLTITGLVADTALAQPRPAPTDTSWGKAGVSLENYRTDAVLCARHAVAMDISETQAAQTMVAASRAVDTAASGAWNTPSAPTDQAATAIPNLDISRTASAYRPERQFRALSELQYQALSDCLRQLGYRQFRLTRDQQRQLGRLRHGSDERRNFLHGLASSPEVLEQQGL